MCVDQEPWRRWTGTPTPGPAQQTAATILSTRWMTTETMVAAAAGARDASRALGIYLFILLLY